MSLTVLKEFKIHNNNKLSVRSATVKLSNEKYGFLIVYSADNIDPGEEYYHHPTDTLKISMYSSDGELMWTKDLGTGVIPGIWFCPVLPLDLDQDGVDEIYFVNNINPDAPFSMVYRKLEALSAVTGETIGRWDWPQNTFHERMSLCYRFYLVSGYSHGIPVLVTCQGTYGDMYLQGYGPGMVKMWERVISKNDGGPKASHLTPVLDFNDDGVDELFWGERLISLDDGHDVMCFDVGNYNGHSDIIVPFVDYETGKNYLYTCREDETEEPDSRVVTYNYDGTKVWTAIDNVYEGHMHYGWLATVGEEGNVKRVAMAMKYSRAFGKNSVVIGENEEFYFDAITGETTEINFPCKGSLVFPIDINGDGFSEFYCFDGEYNGCIFDKNGEIIAHVQPENEKCSVKHIKNGHILKDYKCEQLMLFYDDGSVKIYGDNSPKGSEIFNLRHSYKGYHNHAQTLTATGYNFSYADITCGI